MSDSGRSERPPPSYPPQGAPPPPPGEHWTASSPPPGVPPYQPPGPAGPGQGWPPPPPTAQPPTAPDPVWSPPPAPTDPGPGWPPPPPAGGSWPPPPPPTDHTQAWPSQAPPPPPGGGWPPPPPGGAGGWQQPPPGGAGGWQQPPPGGAGGWQQPPPYQQYGYPAPAGAKTEPLSIWALVLGIVSFPVCPVIAAIAAIIVGSRAKKAVRASGDTKSGHGMALAGQILGVVNIVVSLGVVALIVVGVSFAQNHTSYTNLSTGDCFNRAHGLFGSGSLSTSVHVVGCDQPHDAEVVGSFEQPDGDWPGLTGFRATAGPRCDGLKQQYVTAPRPGLVVRFLYPGRRLWDSGTHTVVCEVRNGDGTKLTGSVGSGGSTTAS